jgi:tRNA(Ile)-lysidine synthase
MPVLEAQLGPGVAAALARTAQLARADADALDGWASSAFAELGAQPDDGFDVAELAILPAAVRGRVLRLAALAAGSPVEALAAVHVAAAEALVTDWRGQGAVSLPGGRSALRRYGKLYFGGAASKPGRDSC